MAAAARTVRGAEEAAGAVPAGTAAAAGTHSRVARSTLAPTESAGAGTANAAAATSNPPPVKIGRRQYAGRHGSYTRTEGRRFGRRFLGHYCRVHLRAPRTDAAMGAIGTDRQGHPRDPPDRALSCQGRSPE